MFEAVLEGRISCWIRDAVSKYGASVNILDVKPMNGKEGMQELFEINVKPEVADHVLEDLRHDSCISEVETIRPRNGTIYGAGKVRGRPICRAFMESKCFLMSARSKPNSTMEWTVRGAEGAFRDLMDRLEADGYETEVKRISSFDDDKLLTPRQTEMLEVALERGYFDFPRRTNLHQLASGVGVKPATLSEVLRRAQKKALTKYMKSLLREA